MKIASLILELRSQGITDENVLNAISSVKRELFVPDNAKNAAYQNQPLPIGYNQTISQPYIVALTLQLAELNSNSIILDVGTGSGYAAYVASKIVKKVYTIETIEELYHSSKKLFSTLQAKNIFCYHGNGYKGLPEHAPYDAILVSACADSLTQTLLNQLKTNGKLIVPIEQNNEQHLYQINKVLPVRFVPLVHKSL